jgi:hypothetical protein
MKAQDTLGTQIFSFSMGNTQKKIENNNWKEYVINWQAARKNQLSRSIQRDMGELFCAIQKRIKQL